MKKENLITDLSTDNARIRWFENSNGALSRKTMKKISILFLLGLFIFFFVGFIDVGYEYSSIHIFIKYPPTMNFYFFCSDGLIEQTNPSIELLYYNHYLEIWEKMGIWSDLIPFIGIQIFLTMLFVSYSSKYNYKRFIIDFILFIISFFFIALFIKFALYMNNIMWYIFSIILLLILNFFTWNKIRNIIFTQLHL